MWEEDESFALIANYIAQATGQVPKDAGVSVAPPGASANGEPAPTLSKNELKRQAKGIVKNKEKKEITAIKKEQSEKKKEKKETKELKVAVYNGKCDGSKKVLSDHDMPEAYNPSYVEAAWSQWWEKCGYYACDVAKATAAPADRKFVMVIPPPNVTGSLHLGHALTAAIEDSLTRWHRMRGDATLYVPGIDHAGIATQSVVEKKLAKDDKLTRHDLGREEFVKRVWQWKDEYGGKIQNQIRLLGSSVDWGREAFTMNPMLTRAVVEAFVRMNEQGLIYRATRLVNWSCALKSAISDIEVDFIDLEGRTMMAVPGHTKRPTYEFGTLTHFAYTVEGSDEELVVATTRLETMLGDTGVAVHPDDTRYKHLHGKYLIHPFNKRKIPIITDGVLVDMAFGTGAVKVTPAHDPNDYECGKRNKLDSINILNLDGTMNSEAAPFEGMARYDARVACEEALEKMGLLRGKEDNKMRLGICSRSGDIIEPYLAPQWYVKCDDMAARAINEVREGRLKIEPSHHEKTWYRWLEGIRDWCVSRQLWWGHRIPAYFAQKKGEGLDRNDAKNNERWFVARTEEDAIKMATAQLHCTENELELEQDPDVLDTWFSSGLFPFSVFGWPEKTPDLDAFYPTSLLETGADILFFWVARMVMMGLQLTDQLPFHTVFLHPMVRDKYGRKMSKSLGNVVDPLEVIHGCTLQALLEKLDAGNLPAKEIVKAKKSQTDDFPDGIPECGADALRFGLLAYTTQGRDINLDISRVVGYRNFCNKLWNATRFALTYVTEFKPSQTIVDDLRNNKNKAPRDKFILSRLSAAVSEANRCFAAYDFGTLTSALYTFWLHDLCDNYLELIKPVVNDMSESNTEARLIAQGCLYLCLDTGLRLLHPIMPFVTEDLWQRLPGRGTLGNNEAESIMVAPYPEDYKMEDSTAEANYEIIKHAIHSARSLRATYGLPPSAKAEFSIKVDSAELEGVIKNQISDFCFLSRAANCATFVGNTETPGPEGCAMLIVDSQMSVYIQLRGMVDFGVEIAKLEKQLEAKAFTLKTLQNNMSKPTYADKVPEAVRLEHAQKVEELTTQRDGILKAIEDFTNMANSA